MFVCIQYMCVCRHENVSRDALRSETCFKMYVLMLASSKLAALCMYANAFRDLVRENYEIIPCWVRDADFAEEILTLSKKTNDRPNTIDDAEHEVGKPDCTGQQLVVANGNLKEVVPSVR